MSWNWRQGFSWILRVNLIFLAIDALLLPLLALFSKTDIFTISLSGYFSTMLLLNSGILFFAGGIIAFSSSIFPTKVRELLFHKEEQWSQDKHRKSEEKANLYILAGILLFVESLVSVLFAF
jgi:NADH:ubiquinone oxidoreductase subunit 5 (subunit L)/multisubunit Na+/H+ antiporter MnhA subunit